MKGLYQKYFESSFDSNPYIARLKVNKQTPTKIAELTTHCAGHLQQVLMGEGLSHVAKNERSYLSNLTINLLDLEL